MLGSFWDTCQIILYGFYLTFGEVEFVSRLRKWWNKQPQIEEQQALRALAEAPRKEGYTCIITGANSGVGKETAFYMLSAGYHVIMASRSKQLAESAIAEISKRASSKGIEANIEFIPLDLSDQVNIHQFVSVIQKRGLKIDLLVNNAGVMWVPKSQTKEGIEMHFGVNYVGHFLLTMLLLPLMIEPARILCLTSHTSRYGRIPFDDINLTKVYNRFEAYSNSKLAVNFFSQSLAQKLKISGKNISVHCIDPGTANTEITKTMPIILQFLFRSVGKFIFKTAFQGACCSIYAALSKELDKKTGLFLYEGKIQKNVRSEKKYDKEREMLWELTEELTTIKFPF